MGDKKKVGVVGGWSGGKMKRWLVICERRGGMSGGGDGGEGG